MTVALDGFDVKLLAALQQNAALTNAELGEAIGLSASQVSAVARSWKKTEPSDAIAQRSIRRLLA